MCANQQCLVELHECLSFVSVFNALTKMTEDVIESLSLYKHDLVTRLVTWELFWEF